MAIHWQIPFRSLRANTLYTVNIYDSTYSDAPIVLKGGAQPFTTQEADDEDGFIPIRTQTGYLRIIDNGLAADERTPFNWKQLLPSTDTDRPVTLTDTHGNIVWQGFMQAQNFSGTLYGNPQEREFPVQCALTVLEGTDINYQHTEIENFAYLLNYIVGSIPVISIDTIKIQGNTDAQQWLLKRIDWQNFADEDTDGNLSARFNLYQCLEDMCRFWGWTARTYGTTLYLTCADDPQEQLWLTLNRQQLSTMAGGTAAGTTGGTFPVVTLSGDIFASTAQDDFRQRGPNKATVQSDGNGADEKVIDYIDDKTADEMEDMGWQSSIIKDGHYIYYTKNLLSIERPLIKGTATSGKGSFNVARLHETIRSEAQYVNEIRMLANYNGSTFAHLETVYEHLFYDGVIELHADIYRYYDKFKDISEREEQMGSKVGNKTMYMKLGIGHTRATAQWYNGRSWQSSETSFTVSIGNGNDTLYIVSSSTTGLGGTSRSATSSISVSGQSGRIYLDFLGSRDLDDIDGVKTFEIADFNLQYHRIQVRTIPEGGGRRSYKEVDRADTREYKSTNGNNVREDFNADCIYASDNDMNFGYGVLMNPDGTYLVTAPYGGQNLVPEQHMADRVTAYWATAKRRLATELRSNAGNVSSVTPQTRVSLDGSTLFPIAFGREWRDDITKLTLLEL